MARLNDLTGQRFGLLTVVARVQDAKPVRWHCKCDCGVEKDVLADNLTRGLTRSCGAAEHRVGQRRARLQGSWQDIAGNRFGRLTAVAYDRGKRRWLCRCDCGGTCMCNVTELSSGLRMDCGCEAARAAAQRVLAGQSGLRQGTNVHTIRNIMGGKIRAGNSSGVTGVSVRRNAASISYRTSITVQRREIYLGTYATLEKAKQARKAAEQKYFAPLIEKDDKQGAENG